MIENNTILTHKYRILELDIFNKIIKSIWLNESHLVVEYDSRREYDVDE